MKLHLIVIIIFLIASCNRSNETKELAIVCISDSSRHASSAYLTSDENNEPVISWCETDAKGKKYFFLSFFNHSTNNFDFPITIPLEQNASMHEEGMPKIAIKKDRTIVAIYETSTPTDNNEWAGAVRYIQSIDKGRSWTIPRCVHADTSAGKSRSFASITRLSNGELGACWLDAPTDPANGGRSVMFASTAQNKGFSNQVMIDSKACECCRTAISSNDMGMITVVYRDIINDSIRDMSISKSSDNGISFSNPISFSGDNWIINGCPHNGPSVANDKNYSYATWFTGGKAKGVYYCSMTNGENAISKHLISSAGQFIQLCLLEDGTPIVAYNEAVIEGTKTYSNLKVAQIKNNSITGLTISDKKTMVGYPVIKPISKDRLVVAWKTNEKILYSIVPVSKLNADISTSFANTNVTIHENRPGKVSSTQDLVCGMSLSIGDTVIYNGLVYQVCSEVCKQRFKSNPISFIK